MIKSFYFIFGLIGLYLTTPNISLMGSYSKGDALSNQVIARTGERLSKKYHLSFSGIGGGEKDGKTWLMSVSFNRYGEPLTIEQGRRIIVDCVQEYLADINRHEELRPYLSNYPFTAHNLDIAIFNFNSKGESIVDPYLEVMADYKGEMMYFTSDPENSYRYKSRTYESYEEALAILEKENIPSL